MITTADVQQYLLGPIVSHWFARFEAADKAKQRFNVMKDLCRQFLGSSAKAMWEDSFRREFYPKIEQPQFMVSLNKAFELVAIIGPSLYWQNPVRQVKSVDKPDQSLIAKMMGIMDEQRLQQMTEEQQADGERDRLRNSLITTYLEYAGKEQPGGMKTDNELVIQDALVTGMGCGWTETYGNRGTGELLTGTFYDPVDNLFVDPDARDPQWRDVRWISRRHVEMVDVVERRFGYPPGYLKGRGTHVSAEFMAQQAALQGGQQMYMNCIEWYEVWSCGGIGARVTGVNDEMGQALDGVTGDYCYMCVSKNVPHPLNLRPEVITLGTPDDIKQALQWRTSKYGSVNELWRDRRWPVETLVFYPIVGSVWPMAVLGPGIGSLLAMNLLLVTHLGQSWDRRRDIIVANEAFVAQVDAALRSDSNPAVIRINSAAQVQLNQVVDFLDRPEVKGNLLEWMEYLDNQFQMATGLDDLHYGISQKQVRVTGDIQARQAASNVRPEKMATDVHRFVVECSKKEMWLAAQHVDGEQLAPLVGEWGSLAWNTLVRSEDVGQLMKELDVDIEASNMRRPNRDKDMSDLERLLPYWLPILQQYCPDTTDTAPANALLARFADAMNMKDVDSLFLGDWRPPAPDPNAMALQSAEQEAEIAKKQAEAQETQAKTAGRLADAQFKQMGATAPTMQKIRFNELMQQQKMRMGEETHLQKLLHMQEEASIKPKPVEGRA